MRVALQFMQVVVQCTRPHRHQAVLAAEVEHEREATPC
jgi:hypothetical protein